MPKRLQISSGAGDWTAEAAGARISLTPGDAALTVTPADGRLLVDGLGTPVTGVAAAIGHDVWVTIAGEVFSFTVTHGAFRHRERRDDDVFTPPMSATVVRIAVKPGAAVKDGDVLIALEAMKMELPIKAPRDGVVRAIHCREGQLVQPGDVLIEME